MPAFANAMSSRPNRSTAVETSCSTSASADTSPATVTTASPSSLATGSSASPFRSPTTTRPPSATMRRVVASPMPDAPPVTIATLPSKRVVMAADTTAVLFAKDLRKYRTTPCEIATDLLQQGGTMSAEPRKRLDHEQVLVAAEALVDRLGWPHLTMSEL